MHKKDTRRGIALLCATCGLPFGMLTEGLPLILRSFDLSAMAIGQTYWLQLVWSIKLLWAPAVDRKSSLPRWVRATAGALAAAFLAMAVACRWHSLPLLAVAIIVCAVASATMDLVADATLVRIAAQGLLSTTQAGGVRTASFKAGLTLGCGGATALAGVMGWAAPHVLLAAWTLWGVPTFMRLTASLQPVPPLEAEVWQRSLRAWLRRRQTMVLLMFSVAYKLALAAAGPMIKLMWLERGVTLLGLGAAAALPGLVGTTAGATAAAWLTSRYGLTVSLLLGSLLEMVACLAAAAATIAAPVGAAAWPAVIGCTFVEAVAQGLTTTALLLLLLRQTNSAFAATQLGILSATFGLTRSLGGALGGTWVAAFGTTWCCVLASSLALVSLVPMAALVPTLRRPKGASQGLA